MIFIKHVKNSWDQSETFHLLVQNYCWPTFSFKKITNMKNWTIHLGTSWKNQMHSHKPLISKLFAVSNLTLRNLLSVNLLSYSWTIEVNPLNVWSSLFVYLNKKTSSSLNYTKLFYKWARLHLMHIVNRSIVRYRWDLLNYFQSIEACYEISYCKGGSLNFLRKGLWVA